MTLFILANSFMAFSLYLQYIDSSTQYQEVLYRLRNILISQDHDGTILQEYHNYKVRSNITYFMLATYPIFPLFYYLRMLRFINLETYIITQGMYIYHICIYMIYIHKRLLVYVHMYICLHKDCKLYCSLYISLLCSILVFLLVMKIFFVF